MRLAVLLLAAVATSGFVAPGRRPALSVRRRPKLSDEVEEAVQKTGVEGGLFSIFSSDADAGEKATSAKDLLKQYGGAYLLTSTSFALVSFSICYALVSNGVDVASLLAKVGIDATASAEKGTTIAIAYAAHKAASPIRFPPTVALTPVVAKLLKGGADDAEEGE
mmetsp:Transcript_20522/g.61191  ORF Transcript_20522/g.61191 Transcript_20522/m.61191 type:complete len:165 (+) Transcript_20522:206-700(+)